MIQYFPGPTSRLIYEQKLLRFINSFSGWKIQNGN